MSTISFWGAAGTVTGSKYLLETDRARVLVDCGLFQGGHELRERNWAEPPFNAAQVDAVVITHAHIDHTGYLPRFVNHGFRGPVFCSRGTADLLKILLPDAARLQEEEADYRNRHKITKHLPALPLYTERDARETLKLIQVVENNAQPVAVAQGLSAEFRIAGHILDSPMASAATKAYAARTEEQDEEYAKALKITPTPLRTHSMLLCDTREQSKQLNSAQGARLIIAASGMMNGGRVLHHALRLLPDENATVVFVGYQAAGTLGRGVADGEKQVKVLGQWLPVRCQIEKIGGFSAHADWKEIIRWLEGLPSAPRRVFVTHGEPEAAQAMAGHIRERFGWQIEVAQYGEKFELI